MQISLFISDSYSINLCLCYQLCLICLLIPLYFSIHLHRYPGIFLSNVWTLPSESCLPFCLVQVYSYLCGQGRDLTGIKDVGFSYELEQVQNFSDSISFQDGHYYVHLPWNKDLVKQVPSNLKASLAVAERVYKNLEKQNIANAYEEVFEQQEALGIIEPVNQKMPDQIWIPHRSVIRNESNVMTKIGPVFNCSLKMDKAPSLKEATFPGIDLMNNLLSLLLYFRSNFYVLLSDIAEAFLQIRLHLKRTRTDFVSLGRLTVNLYLTDTVLSSLGLFLAHSSLTRLYSIIYQLILLIMFLL